MSMHYTTRNRRNVREMKEIIRDYHQLKELPSLGNFLTLIACHTDRELKLNTIKPISTAIFFSLMFKSIVCE